MSVAALTSYNWVGQLLANSGVRTSTSTARTTAAQSGGRSIFDTVTLSPQAQALLASGTAGGIGSSGVFTADTTSTMSNRIPVVASGQDFSGLNLSGLDMRNGAFDGSTLVGTNFTGSDLRGADFSNALLTGASFLNADLRGADLGNAEMTGAVLTDTNLLGTDLTKAVGLTAANAGQSLRDTGIAPDYSYGALVGMDFTKSNLQYANFTYTDLSGSNFFFADLKGADFSHATLTGANLAFADLSGADLSTAIDLKPSQLIGATTDATTKLPW